MRIFVLGFLLSIFAAGCATNATDSVRVQNAQASEPVTRAALAGPVDAAFGNYWYQGKAELTSYTLEQARYGEIHKGNAVLIFVTEDLSRSKQVKLDHPEQAGDDRVNVLKLNFTKKFNTGIYPYSMMTSVFTPIQRSAYPQTLKITNTSQEWCGQTFTQMNLTDTGYRVRLYSYFENEGDQEVSFRDAIPEDEIWTTIRLNPDDLPLGAVRLIPGAIYQRFSHTPWKAQAATAQIQPDEGNPELRVYTLHYPDLERTLTIRFKKIFPHEIESWEDAYKSGFGPEAALLTTTATVKKRIWLDYWTKNHVRDEPLAGELGLD